MKSYSHTERQNQNHLRIGQLVLLGESVNSTDMHVSFVLTFAYFVNFITR